MTPIKRFVYVGLVIYVEDYAGMMQVCCIAASKDQRDFILHSLKDFHGVPADEVTPESVRTGTYGH